MIGAYSYFFWYLLRHKWYVLQACWALRVPLWQAIIHDLTKLRPAEFFPYAEFFYVYGTDTRRWGREPIRHVPGFERRIAYGKNHHQTKNKHHWQYWLLPPDQNGNQQARAIPERYVREMVADWTGAGRAQGNGNTAGWYLNNQHDMVLHPATRQLVEQVLREAQHKGVIPAEPAL